MLPHFLISVGQLVFWLRYIYDIRGGRDGPWVEARVPVMGKLGIFQCNVILSVDGNMQYDSAFFGHSFFWGGGG